MRDQASTNAMMAALQRVKQAKAQQIAEGSAELVFNDKPSVDILSALPLVADVDSSAESAELQPRERLESFSVSSTSRSNQAAARVRRHMRTASIRQPIDFDLLRHSVTEVEGEMTESMEEINAKRAAADYTMKPVITFSVADQIRSTFIDSMRNACKFAPLMEVDEAVFSGDSNSSAVLTSSTFSNV